MYIIVYIMDLNGWFFHILALKLLKHDSCPQVSVFMKQGVKWNVIIRRVFRIVYVLVCPTIFQYYEITS